MIVYAIIDGGNWVQRILLNLVLVLYFFEEKCWIFQFTVQIELNFHHFEGKKTLLTCGVYNIKAH